MRASTKHRILLIINVLLLHSFCSISYSNEIVFEKIDNREGLSSDQINKIYQDLSGYIWIATDDGLNRFTGTEFKVFRHEKSNPNSLSSSHVRCVSSAPDGKLWIGTKEDGINILNPVNEKIQRITTADEDFGLIDNNINNIICDSKGRMWISTVAGLSCYDTKSQSPISMELPTEKVGSVIYEDAQGNIIIGSWAHSLYIFNEETQSVEPIDKNGENKIRGAVKCIFEDQDGYLWVGTWGRGLYKVRLVNKQLEFITHSDIWNDHYSKENTYNIVYDIIQDKDGKLWLGTDVGLGIIHQPEEVQINISWIAPGKEKYNFRAKDASCLFIDAANTVWIGTQGDGISKADFNQSNFKTYKSNTRDAGNGSEIFRSFWYHNDELYVGINALGFGKYDLEKEEFTPYTQLPLFNGFKKSSVEINAITSCVPLNKHTLWMMTRYKGALAYDTKFHKLQQIYFPLNINEGACYLIEKNKIWVGTNSGLMLCVPDSKRKGLFPYKKIIYQHSDDDINSISRNKISHILRDKDGRVWVSFFDGGIDEVIEDPMDPEKIHFKKGIKDDIEFIPDINLMYEDSRGYIWLGTEGNGLWLFHKSNNNIVNFSTSTAIRGNSIYGIIEDDQNHLWLSTNRGLSSINILNLGNPYVINYTVEDGLQGNIFNRNASFKNEKGELFFGGYHGFNCFHPDDIRYNNYMPPLVFTSIEVDRAQIDLDYRLGEALVLNHKNKSFQINFAALSYTKSTNNQYRYKLDGYDQEWLSTDKGLNKAIYGKLPAGEYKFLLMGSNNNGVWSEHPLTLDIIVKKSPFKTLLAYTLYFLITILILWSIFYYTKRHFTLEQAYKDEQNERHRAEKINQFKLKFFTNISHELLTPLSIISNAIEMYLEKKPQEGPELAIVQRNTNRLKRLITQLLDFRKAEGDSRKLMVEKCNFNHIISSMSDNFLPLCEKKNINFITKGHIDQEIYVDIDKIDKMLHNILSNAFKHTPENGEIWLEYQTFEKENKTYVKLSISDSGKGIPEGKLETIFERFYRIDESKHESGAGIGLAFTKSLVTLHKGQIEARNNEKGGASFILEFPVSRACYHEDEIAQKTDPNRKVEYAFADEMDEIKVPLRMVRENQEDLPKILLVEDNIDMRTIMRKYLSKYFDVYEGNNGVEGLEVLKKVDIELIISDIMMSEMDGLTFCRQVKNDISTSHIPVILTTAKRTQENFIEGYEAQADSYITKPVNLQLLLVRIINLLKQRDELRKVFSNGHEKKKIDLDINNLDQELFDKLDKYILDNISNNDLSIGMLAEHVNISSSVFYRKIKSFTGMSPNEYLRSKRLNVAAQMLKNGYSASNVAYECGFSNPSYFGVCFKKEFGVTPKKYVDNLQ